jgi:hypothetical protein
MESIITIVAALNSLSPIAVIGGLGFIIYKLITSNKTTHERFTKLETNDLHELPEIAETLRRIELSQSESFATIITMLRN